MVSDSTGETAARLVQALEAQFPEQEFVEIRHPRVETVADLQLAVDRMKGRPAVVDLHARRAGRCARRCARSAAGAKLHYCDLLGQPIDAVAKVSGQRARDDARARGRRSTTLLPADRRRSSSRSSTTTASAAGSRRRHRARRRLAHLEDAALDLPRLPRLQGDERAAREGDRAAGGAVRDRPGEDRRPDDRREPARRRSAASGSRWMRGDRQLRRASNEIYEELEHADAIHRRLGCPVIDVSELSIEEIAHRIIRAVERRRQGAGGGTPVKPKPPVPTLALGALVRAARRRARSSSTASSRRSGSGCARSPGSRSSGAQAGRPSRRAGCVGNDQHCASDGRALRLRLRRAAPTAAASCSAARGSASPR